MGKQRTSGRRPSIGVTSVLCVAFLAAGYGLLLWRMSWGEALPASQRRWEGLEEVVFSVNGAAVTAREVEQRIAYLHRSAAIRHFSQGREIQVDETFWDTEFDGVTPRAFLREESIEDCARVKIQEMAMQEQGLLEDVSYQSFLDAWEAENVRRAQSAQRGEVIYGPQQYQENEYFVYVFSNLQQDLKEKMAQTLHWNDEEALRAYYEAQRDRYFRLSDTLEVESVSVAYDRASREQVLAQMEAVRRAVEAGTPFSQAAEGLGSIVHHTFNEDTAREDSRYREPLKLAAMELSPGALSPVVDDGETYHLVYCLEKKAGGYRPFDEVQDNVASLVIQEQYEAWLDAQYEEATIQMKNEEVFKRVK